MVEASLQNLSTLDGYNENLKVWISECYHNKEHSALKDTPANAYRKSKAHLRFADPNVLAEAFLHFETRKVDKSGCISLFSRLYEVSLSLIGSKVDVLYDPADISIITVKHGASGFDMRVPVLEVGTRVAQRPKMPASLLPKNPESSRLLSAKADIYNKNRDAIRSVIRYGEAGVDSNV